MANQNSWKTALTGVTSKDSAASGESTASSNLNSSILFNGSEGSTNSLQLNIHRLNGKNYTEWSQTVRLILEGKGKLGYLTGEVTKPADGDSTLKTWKVENSLIIVWLVNSMEPAIGKPFMYLPTAKDVWEAVRDTYSDMENSSQIFDLKFKLWHAKQGDRDVTSYYNEIMTLWQELDLCYDDVWECMNDSIRFIKRQENDRVFMFLVGLNKELDEVRGRILGKNPLPTNREAFSEVWREEARQSVMLNNKFAPITTNSEVESSALVTRSFQEGVKKDGKHFERPWCDHCKRPWHTRETCWKIHGKPQNRKKRFGGEGRALQASVSDQEQQSSSSSFPFTKEQIDQLCKLLESQKIPFCSLAQKGFDLGEDDWQC